MIAPAAANFSKGADTDQAFFKDSAVNLRAENKKLELEIALLKSATDSTSPPPTIESMQTDDPLALAAAAADEKKMEKQEEIAGAIVEGPAPDATSTAVSTDALDFDC